MAELVHTRTPTNRWQAFRTAAWLGWQIESNWTRPAIFAIYAIAKPLAISGILVVMYGTATGGNFSSPMFPYLYLGNAFYLYVGAVMSGMAFAVIDDRERYRMLASVYVAPIDLRVYLAGRGVARFVTASISVALTIALGVIVLHVRIDPVAVDWPLFVGSLAVGVVMLGLLGLLLAGVMLNLVHQSWGVGEAVSGVLYLFSGAVFPLDVLPRVLRPIGYAMPMTYWLELLRRSLVGSVAQAFPTLAGVSDARLFGILLMMTLAFGAAGLLVFQGCDARARSRGVIDRTSNY